VNFKEAMKWFNKAAERGDTNALNWLGNMYQDGKGVSVNYEEALRLYTKAAARGNASAMNNLGTMYNRGQGVDVNFKEAMKWFNKAAERGDTNALDWLGNMYRDGEGVSVNYKEAFRWYQMAAEKGSSRAFSNLGNMYRNGEGVSVNYEEALRWYNKAADGGEARAMAWIGYLTEKGLGVTRDPKLAVIWYQKAIAKDPTLRAPLVFLAMTFARGIGNPMDPVKAEELFQQSIQLGNKDGVYYSTLLRFLEKWSHEGQRDVNSLLGVIYEKGLLDAPPSKQKAIEYYLKGCNEGDEFAKVRLEIVDPTAFKPPTAPTATKVPGTRFNSHFLIIQHK
jgi:hypothetical protein